jgi:hypothetical protein
VACMAIFAIMEKNLVQNEDRVGACKAVGL